MLGIDRNAARATWTVALVLLALALIYLARTTLFVFVLALLFAYLLSPLVNLLDRILPARTGRTPALALAYILVVAAVVFAGMHIGSLVAEQAASLAKDFPHRLAQWERPSPGAPAAVNDLKQQLIGRAREQIAAHSGTLMAFVPAAGLKAVAVAGNLIHVVIVPILAFFFLKDGRAIRQQLLGLVDDPRRRELADDLIADIHLLLAQYMRALVILSLAAFTVYSVFFLAIGVPYPVLLAALGGVLEFIPMLGPLVSTVLIVAVAWVSGGNVLAVLLIMVAYRMVTDYVLSPYFMGSGVELHPLAVLFGVFAGAEIAGIPGAFLSVPVLALARVVWVRVRKARTAACTAS